MKPKNLRAEIESLDSDLKIQYVFSRCKTTSNGKAINDAGFSTATFYGWPQEERDYLNSLAMRLKTETGLRATLLLQEAAESAAKVKIDGLKSRNERIKQASATEVLDRIIGKPFQSLITQVNMAADEEDSQEMTLFNSPADASQLFLMCIGIFKQPHILSMYSKGDEGPPNLHSHQRY